MPLEPVDHLDDLVVTNPTDTDPVSEGDNHIRNLKIALAAGVTGNADQTRLLVGAVVKFLAQGIGVDVRTAVDIDQSIRVLNSDAPDVGYSLRMRALSGLLELLETDGVGAPGNVWQTFTRGAGVGLNFADNLRLSSTTGGAEVSGDTLDLVNVLDAVTTLLIRNGDGGLVISKFPGPGGTTFVRQTDSDGLNPKNWGAFEVDAGVKWRFNGDEAFATIDPTRNSSAQVFDVNGTARPIGYNTLPPTTVPTSTPAINDHNGHTIDLTGAGITYTLADLYAGWTVNVLCSNAAGAGILVPGGLTLNLYEGDNLRTFGGPSTLQLNRGSAVTVTQRGGGAFNAWGGVVA